MPRRVRRRRHTESGKLYKIVESGGKVVGQSDKRSKAESSAKIANDRSTEKR